MIRRDSAVKWVIIAVLAIILFAAVGLVWNFQNKTTLQIGSKVVSARIADSDPERTKGLSGTKELKDNEAMLFTYETSGNWGIWMKDMNYSIDIIWLDDQKKVIHIVEHASPDSYPKVFEPGKNARYVVELAAGYVRRNNVSVGSSVTFYGEQR